MARLRRRRRRLLLMVGEERGPFGIAQPEVADADAAQVGQRAEVIFDFGVVQYGDEILPGGGAADDGVGIGDYRNRFLDEAGGGRLVGADYRMDAAVLRPVGPAVPVQVDERLVAVGDQRGWCGCPILDGLQAADRRLGDGGQIRSGRVGEFVIEEDGAALRDDVGNFGAVVELADVQLPDFGIGR